MKFLPFGNDVVEVLENNPPDRTVIFRCHIVREGFTDLKTFHIEPKLAVHFSLARVDMDWLVPFIGVKEKNANLRTVVSSA